MTEVWQIQTFIENSLFDEKIKLTENRHIFSLVHNESSPYDGGINTLGFISICNAHFELRYFMQYHGQTVWHCYVTMESSLVSY